MCSQPFNMDSSSNHTHRAAAPIYFLLLLLSGEAQGHSLTTFWQSGTPCSKNFSLFNKGGFWRTMKYLKIMTSFGKVISPKNPVFELLIWLIWSLNCLMLHPFIAETWKKNQEKKSWGQINFYFLPITWASVKNDLWTVVSSPVMRMQHKAWGVGGANSTIRCNETLHK